MRGRLWTLWVFQTVEGVLCVFMALSKDSLGVTILFMVLFSICVQVCTRLSPNPLRSPMPYMLECDNRVLYK